MRQGRYPLMGNAVWIRKDGRLLLGKRTGKAGAGTWCPPGGHVELFETIEDAAVREVQEEAGIQVANLKFLNFSEDPLPELDTHYVTFHYVGDWASGEPRGAIGEIEEWEWFTWDQLPTPLFRPAQLFVDMGLNPLEFAA